MVIPTGARRSGGTRGSPNSKPKLPLSLLHLLSLQILQQALDMFLPVQSSKPILQRITAQQLHLSLVPRFPPYNTSLHPQEGALDFKTIIIHWIVRIVEVLFFAGIAGCLVTIALSWYSIF
jgi:hypothetical protein